MPEKIDKETIEAVCDGVRAVLNMTKLELSKAYLRAPKQFTVTFKATFFPKENPEITGVKIDLDFVPEKVHESVTREACETDPDMLPGTKEALEDSKQKARGTGKKVKEKKQDPMTEMPQGDPPARKCGRPEEEACSVIICKEYAEMCSPGCERPQPAINGQKALEGEVVDAEFTEVEKPSDQVEKPEEQIELKEEDNAGGILTEDAAGDAEKGTGVEGEGEAQQQGTGEEGGGVPSPEEEFPGLEKPETSLENGDAVEDKLTLTGEGQQGHPESIDLDKAITEAVTGTKWNDKGVLEGEMEVLEVKLPKGLVVTVTVGFTPEKTWKMGKNVEIHLGDIDTAITNRPSANGPAFESGDHARLAGLETAKTIFEKALEKKPTKKQQDILERGVQAIEEEITRIQGIMMFNMDNEVGELPLDD